MEKMLNQILVELKTLNEKVDRIDLEQQSMKAEMQSMKAEQLTMKDILISHSDHIHQLIQIAGATNARVEELADDVEQLKKDMSELRGSQLKQERILERLAIRSIALETVLADLRRIK